MKLLVCLVWATSVAGLDSGVGTPEVGLKSSERSLHVRSIPAIHGYSSNVYEIHMQPFTYNARPLTASAELKSQDADEAKAVRGELMFVQHRPPTGPVLITGNVTGLAPGPHGFHVHAFGDLRKGCASAGPHFDPYMQPHGGPVDPYRHVGDLGNILAGEDGVSRVEIWDQMISLTGTHSILGRSIVIHEMKDDYGRGGDTESMMSGNAGARLACGVIGVTEDTMMMPPPMMPPPMMPPPWQQQGSWDSFDTMGPSGPGNMGSWQGQMGPGPGQMGPGPGQMGPGSGHMGPGPGHMGPGPGQMGPGPGQMGPGPGQMGPGPGQMGPGQGPGPRDGQGPETVTAPPAPLNDTPEPLSESAPVPEV